MADPKKIEQELRDFLSVEDTMRKSDKIIYLMAIINKHIELDKIDHLMTHSDFEGIIGKAKASFSQSMIPMYLSRRELGNAEVNHILILEAFIGYLNRNKLLKRLIKLDYRR